MRAPTAAGGDFVQLPRAALEEPLGVLFERQVARSPHSVAAKGRRHTLTYGEIERSANQLAHAILARRGPGVEPIALLFAHDAPVFAAILAVLKAGKIYVPLDPHHPPARLAASLADCSSPLIVCDRDHLARARAVTPPGGEVLDAEALASDLPIVPPRIAASGRSLAAICYTSGSTGDPKGIVWDHRGITHRAIAHIGSTRLTPADRVALLQSVAVGAAFRRIFGSLLTGATVLPFDIRSEPGDALASWLAEEGITVCGFAPSVFRHFVGEIAPTDRFPALRYIGLTSETVLRSDVERFRAHFPPPCVLTTGLSTSEAGSLCELLVDETISIDGATVPVGYPLPDKEIMLLDEAGRRVEPGEDGEIAVRSEFLAVGYWKRPDVDARTFLPDPAGGAARICRTGDLGRMRPDGCLLHLGRKDARAKLRGRFVDTGEIETTLHEHPGLAAAVVSIREDRPGDQRLVAHVVARPPASPSVSELQHFLRSRLGDHLVPSALVFLDALPRTPNGKVDRRALPAPSGERPRLAVPYAAPRTPLEETVAGIWAETLGLDRVGIHDDFLELGGTSLVAARITARVCERLQVGLPAQALLEAPRVADMAAVVLGHLLAGMEPAAADPLLTRAEERIDGGDGKWR